MLQGGYGRGTAMALMSGNSIEFLVTYFACAKTGTVCVPITLGWRPPEITHVINHCGARGLIVESQLAGNLTEVLQNCPGIEDIVVAPGTGPAAVAERPIGGRSFITFDDLATDDDAEPQ